MPDQNASVVRPSKTAVFPNFTVFPKNPEAVKSKSQMVAASLLEVKDDIALLPNTAGRRDKGKLAI